MTWFGRNIGRQSTVHFGVTYPGLAPTRSFSPSTRSRPSSRQPATDRMPRSSGCRRTSLAPPPLRRCPDRIPGRRPLLDVARVCAQGGIKHRAKGGQTGGQAGANVRDPEALLRCILHGLSQATGTNRSSPSRNRFDLAHLASSLERIEILSVEDRASDSPLDRRAWKNRFTRSEKPFHDSLLCEFDFGPHRPRPVHHCTARVLCGTGRFLCETRAVNRCREAPRWVFRPGPHKNNANPHNLDRMKQGTRPVQRFSGAETSFPHPVPHRVPTIPHRQDAVQWCIGQNTHRILPVPHNADREESFSAAKQDPRAPSPHRTDSVSHRPSAIRSFRE